MKSYTIQCLGCLVLFLLGACSPDEYKTDWGVTPAIGTDSAHLREPSSNSTKRLTIEEAFLQLPEEKFLVEGIRGLSKIERKLLLQTGRSHHYTCTTVGNYLEIMEIADNVDDEQELLEHLTMGVYNSLTQKPIVFISQELIEEQRAQKQVIEQHFLEYHLGQWTVVDQQLPAITTHTFFEESTATLDNQQHYFYFDLEATDINYLQARLQHNFYPNKDSVALKEAYKVAYIWSGDAFQLNRQAMVQYEISEHHSKQ